jgi:hypothetical protein
MFNPHRLEYLFCRWGMAGRLFGLTRFSVMCVLSLQSYVSLFSVFVKSAECES